MGSRLRHAIGSRFAAVGFQGASPCAMVRIGRWALRRINSQPVGWAAPTVFDVIPAVLFVCQLIEDGLLVQASPHYRSLDFVKSR